VIQDQLLPVEKGRYILGNEFTLADIAVAPFLGRTLLIQLKNDLGKFNEQEAKRGWEHFQGPLMRSGKLHAEVTICLCFS